MGPDDVLERIARSGTEPRSYTGAETAFANIVRQAISTHQEPVTSREVAMRQNAGATSGEVSSHDLMRARATSSGAATRSFLT